MAFVPLFATFCHFKYKGARGQGFFPWRDRYLASFYVAETRQQNNHCFKELEFQVDVFREEYHDSLVAR
jgi:hypothetical protein